MNDSDLHHLAAAYALDALDADERARFEAHFHDCDVCVDDVVGFRSVIADLANASPAVAPSADLKARVMAEVATTRQLPPRVSATVPLRRATGVGRLLAAAAVAASLLLAVGAGFLAGRRGGDTYSARAAEVLTRSDARIVTLAGEAGGQFRVTWSPSSGEAVVTGDDLRDPGDGLAYELWVIDGSTATPVRLLDDASDGTIRQVVKLPATGTQMGVTIEKQSGATTPTAPILFAGDV
jgi:anti-sigma-K factor RskA